MASSSSSSSSSSLYHALSTCFTIIILLWFTINIIPSISASHPKPKGVKKHNNFVRKSCDMTLYPRLCRKVLLRHAHKIGNSRKALASTALQVSFRATGWTLGIIQNMTKKHEDKEWGEAVVECVEEIGESVYELGESWKEWRNVSNNNNNNNNDDGFEMAMNDIETWVSGALTYDETCMDGFEEVMTRTKGVRNVKVKVIRRLVLRIAHLTSIALSFINSYATAPPA